MPKAVTFHRLPGLSLCGVGGSSISYGITARHAALQILSSLPLVLCFLEQGVFTQLGLQIRLQLIYSKLQQQIASHLWLETYFFEEIV